MTHFQVRNFYENTGTQGNKIGTEIKCIILTNHKTNYLIYTHTHIYTDIHTSTYTFIHKMSQNFTSQMAWSIQQVVKTRRPVSTR